MLGDAEVGDQVVGGALEDVADERAAHAAQPAAAEPAQVRVADPDGPGRGWSSPARILSSEDFPLPDGPTTAVTAPAGNAASMPLSAWTSPVAVR